jgi:NADPH-dependent curcumin reductase CurA
MPEEANFELVETDIPSPGPGEVLVRTLYISVDPYMRGRMRAAASYAPPVEIGQVMVGGAVGTVEKSNSTVYEQGDIVEGPIGW